MEQFVKMRGIKAHHGRGVGWDLSAAGGGAVRRGPALGRTQRIGDLSPSPPPDALSDPIVEKSGSCQTGYESATKAPGYEPTDLKKRTENLDSQLSTLIPQPSILIPKPQYKTRNLNPKPETRNPNHETRFFETNEPQENPKTKTKKPHHKHQPNTRNLNPKNTGTKMKLVTLRTLYETRNTKPVTQDPTTET